MSPRYCSPSTRMSMPISSWNRIHSLVAFCSRSLSASEESCPFAALVRARVRYSGLGNEPTLVVKSAVKPHPDDPRRFVEDPQLPPRAVSREELQAVGRGKVRGFEVHRRLELRHLRCDRHGIFLLRVPRVDHPEDERLRRSVFREDGPRRGPLDQIEAKDVGGHILEILVDPCDVPEEGEERQSRLRFVPPDAIEAFGDE